MLTLARAALREDPDVLVLEERAQRRADERSRSKPRRPAGW